MPYSDGLKARMIERMAGPEGISANALSQEVGITQTTLSRWLRERNLVAMTDEKPKSARRWSGEEKLRVVQEAARLGDDELGEFLRREGLHEAQLLEWKAAADAAALSSLSPPKKARGKKKSPEQKRIHELERELRRKEKALAELAALLALRKKVQEIWGDGDDDTDTGSAT